MLPLTADQLSAAFGTTFTVVLNGGQGDCAYIAVGMESRTLVAQALALRSSNQAAKFQAQLRRLMAKEIISN